MHFRVLPCTPVPLRKAPSLLEILKVQQTLDSWKQSASGQPSFLEDLRDKAFSRIKVLPSLLSLCLSFKSLIQEQCGRSYQIMFLLPLEILFDLSFGDGP